MASMLLEASEDNRPVVHNYSRTLKLPSPIGEMPRLDWNIPNFISQLSLIIPRKWFDLALVAICIPLLPEHWFEKISVATCCTNLCSPVSAQQG